MTEKRLIDANEFWNRLQHVVYDVFTVHEQEGHLTGTASVGYYTETIQEVLRQTKTVDAVEVVHGRWNKIAHYPYYCSECGEIAPLDFEGESHYKSNYCPNCGAKMDGDGNGM